MADKHSLTPVRDVRDPFGLFRQIATDLDRVFEDWPALRRFTDREGGWSPRIDVFERDNRLVTRLDLPGVKKEDVTVEVSDGHLALSGERRRETEERKDNVYRTEREYGRFYRTVPLPAGIRLEDITATFADGVLEVSAPLPTTPEPQVRKVQIEEPKSPAKSAA